jgi:hypothetical protein
MFLESILLFVKLLLKLYARTIVISIEKKYSQTYYMSCSTKILVSIWKTFSPLRVDDNNFPLNVFWSSNNLWNLRILCFLNSPSHGLHADNNYSMISELYNIVDIFYHYIPPTMHAPQRCMMCVSQKLAHYCVMCHSGYHIGMNL